MSIAFFFHLIKNIRASPTGFLQLFWHPFTFAKNHQEVFFMSSDKYQPYIQKHQEILTLRDLSESTVSNYISYLTQFFSWMDRELGGKDPSDLSFDDIRAYVRYLKDIRKLNNRTINCHIAQMSDFFRYVLHRDWDNREIPYLRYDQYLPAVPTRKETETIINSISNIKHRTEIAVLYSSGLRVSELCRLHCRDIIASKNYIYVSRSKNRSDRYAVLSTRAKSMLTLYIRTEYPHATKNDWLFPGQKYGEHITPQTVYNVLKKQLATLGWQDKGFNCHSLRHAFGLHLYEAGTDMITIKEAMGHKSLASTEIYLSLGIGSRRSVKSPYDM